jgi:hypothetical protein
LSAGYRSQADYNRNIAQVHFRKGSLLEYSGVYLAEGPWPAKAYFDAHRRARARDAAYFLDYGYTRPDVVSLGPADQHHAGAVHAGAIHPEILPEGLPIPVEGQPTPAKPAAPAAPSDAPAERSGEELPSPGPASVAPPADGPRLSSRKQSGVRQASYESAAVTASDVKGGGLFEWDLNGSMRSAEPKSAENPSPATLIPESNVMRLRLPDESVSSVAAPDDNVKGANQANAPASGWKAKR